MRLSSLLVIGEVLSFLGLFDLVLADGVAVKAFTPQGCFESSDPLEDEGTVDFQSIGACQIQCVELGKAVMGLSKGSHCWCGDLVPAADSKVSDSKCSSPCTGFDKQNCGGPKAWTVLLTGTDNSVGNIDDSGPTTDSATTSSTSGPKSSVTAAPDPNASVATYRPGATTVVVTAPGQSGAISTSSAKPVSKHPKSANTAGIAAGVVVGIVVLCAIVGGLFFYLRNRKRRAIEDEYHRNSSAAGTGHLSSSAMSDSRLEPSVMMQRRQSDGSIADNHDYSRRILKVTNPDGT